MSIPETDLSKRMRALVVERPELATTFNPLADSFDAATAGFYGEPQSVSAPAFLGAFARARKAWCEATGEPLV
jgi:hypothetical protein